jgi:manganese transport protein
LRALPFGIVPLLMFTADLRKMEQLAAPRRVTAVAAVFAVAPIVLKQRAVGKLLVDLALD